MVGAFVPLREPVVPPTSRTTARENTRRGESCQATVACGACELRAFANPGLPPGVGSGLVVTASSTQICP